MAPVTWDRLDAVQHSRLPACGLWVSAAGWSSRRANRSGLPCCLCRFSTPRAVTARLFPGCMVLARLGGVSAAVYKSRHARGRHWYLARQALCKAADGLRIEPSSQTASEGERVMVPSPRRRAGTWVPRLWARTRVITTVRPSSAACAAWSALQVVEESGGAPGSTLACPEPHVPFAVVTAT